LLLRGIISTRHPPLLLNIPHFLASLAKGFYH